MFVRNLYFDETVENKVSKKRIERLPYLRRHLTQLCVFRAENAKKILYHTVNLFFFFFYH